MKKIILYFLLTICFFIEPAHAEYTLYGSGNVPCQEWINNRKTGNWYEMGEWMLGFISAVNYYEVFELRDDYAKVYVLWMDRYCRQNPRDDFGEAVQHLIQEIKVNATP